MFVFGKAIYTSMHNSGQIYIIKSTGKVNVLSLQKKAKQSAGRVSHPVSKSEGPAAAPAAQARQAAVLQSHMGELGCMQ